MKINIRHIRIVMVYMLWFMAAYYQLKASFSNFTGQSAVYSDGIFYLLIDLICIIAIIFLRDVPYHKAIFSAGIVCLWQLIGLSVSEQSQLLIIMMRTVTWFLVFYAVYKYLSFCPEDDACIAKVVSLGMIVLAVFVIQNQNFIRTINDSISGMNELYVVLFAYPFAFTQKKWLKLIGILSVVAMTLLSLKSTALLAVALSTAVYYITSQRIKGTLSVRILLIPFFILILYFVFPSVNEVLANQLNIDWLKKLNDGANTGGSSRQLIWGWTLQEQMNSNFFQWLFGHGYNKVVDYIGFSAHNDFLEVLFDFGVLGFVSYLGLYGTLIRQISVLIRESSPKAPILCMALTIFAVTSFFSHLIIIPGLLVNFGILWAYCLHGNQWTFNGITEE